jgi:MSHA biogenesis protein MshL
VPPLPAPRNALALPLAGALLCASLLCACAPKTFAPSPGHLRDEPRPEGAIPAPVGQVPLPPPRPAPKPETYSVVVNNVPVQELLFALARDAKLNVDIRSGIEGTVTLNAINQTLPQILNRIAKQVDMRYELDGPNLVVSPDTPYLRTYKINYVNMSRESKSNVSIATQIATASGSAAGTTGGYGASGGAAGGGAGGTLSNNSVTAVSNTSNNHFWDTLVQNVKDILRETDKILPEGSSETTVERASTQTTTGTGTQSAPRGKSGTSYNPIAASPNPATLQGNDTTVTKRTTFREAASVIANPETGVIAVRATSRQHEYIQAFLDQTLVNARRQVLIEATVVEVQLSDQYQQGINWQKLSFDGSTGFNLIQAPSGSTPLASNPTATLLTLNYAKNTLLGNLSASIRLLESFGKVKVLSSPKISVLNNQTALLKVVDNRVYFTIQVQVTPGTQGAPTVTTFTSTPYAVPIGFVMNVTPQIDDNGMVTLNVRPTISRIIGYVNDPNPDLANANVISRIPEIQTREMESILKVQSGQTAVMGGLMQDTVNNLKDGVPGVASLPLLGNLLSYRNETSSKTELVVFLRPMVIKETGLDGDYRPYRQMLPGPDFLSATDEAKP